LDGCRNDCFIHVLLIAYKLNGSVDTLETDDHFNNQKSKHKARLRSLPDKRLLLKSSASLGLTILFGLSDIVQKRLIYHCYTSPFLKPCLSLDYLESRCLLTVNIPDLNNLLVKERSSYL
jgi:hypothetical protein